MDAYVIVGNANTRKSSVLRSLTGCFNRSIRDIIDSSGSVRQIYARVSSLQESETTPQDFIQEVSATGLTNVIFCLWPHANRKNAVLYPDAQAYITAFIQAGWQFQASAVLGTTTFQPATPCVAHFPAVTNQPINVTAQAVRSHFGWEPGLVSQ